MVQPKEGFGMEVDWQLTTTTIWCPEVEKRVALIVKGDWTSYCCWHQKREKLGPQGGLNGCKGTQCPHVKAYRDKLVAEEEEG